MGVESSLDQQKALGFDESMRTSAKSDYMRVEFASQVPVSHLVITRKA